MNPILYVDIHKKLNEFNLDITFDIQKGCLGILGPSGCGKSITLKSIAGIIFPDDGYITYNEQVYYDSKGKINKKPQQRKVGYLFQNYALFPNMTIKQNIAISIADANKLYYYIEKFQLQGLENRYPRQLSGGQQQRAALARILAYEPDILLLDEPFSAMDSYLKEQLQMELKQLLKEFDGISILVSHDREEIFELCDEVLLMDQGKIIQKGKTYEVFENPKTVEAAKLTGCKNISKIEKIDQHRMKAIEWNILLEVYHNIDDITHIGIRAHDFKPCDQQEKNSFEIGPYDIIEKPFEWNIVFDNGIWWKVDKAIYNHIFSIPKYLKVDFENILLLKKETK